MPTTNGLSEDYATLGLSDDATLTEVKQAFRDLSMVWHPDRFSEDDTRLRKKVGEKQAQINIAHARITQALTQTPQHSASEAKEAALKDAVDDVTAFFALVTVQALNIEVLMRFCSASRTEIETKLKEFSANTREAVKRMEALICRIERELPEYPRTELESILTELSQRESEVSKDVAEYIHIHFEPYQEARQSTPPPREPVDATSFGHHATHNEPKDKRNLKWVVLFLLGAAGLWLIIARTSSVPSQPSTDNSTSTSSGVAALQPSPSVEPQPADPSASTTTDEKPATQDDPNAQETANEREVRETVEGWANAFRARDAKQFANCYAIEVEQFFRKEDVSRSQIYDEYLKSFGRIDTIIVYDISDLHVEFPVGASSLPRATATYDKTWDTSQTDGKRNSGEEVERLTFEKFDDGWKIVREEELQVIRSSRQ